MPREALLSRVRAEIEGTHAAMSRADLEARIRSIVRGEEPLLGLSVLDTLVDSVVAEVRGLGPLEELLADSTVTDILVNGPSSVWVERRGHAERVPTTLSEAALVTLIERIVGPLGLRVDRSSPIVDARLPDGARVHAVMPPVAVDGPYLAIRRFRATPVPLEAFASQHQCELLRRAVSERRNILISGGTGTGKTTLLNALAASVDQRERIVTIEDAAELQLPLPHVVRLEARPANADGFGEISIRQLVRSALRLRPDRIIVGEVRGAEAFDLLQAMNTGHAGSMSTIHANSPVDALRRLELLVLQSGMDLPLAAVATQVSSTIDLVVQLARGADGTRQLVELLDLNEPSGHARRELSEDRSGCPKGEGDGGLCCFAS